MTDHEPRDLDRRDLDTLLSASAPTTSLDGPVRTAALEAMARDARPSRGRRVRRPLLAGAGAIALVLAGGMAASAAFDWPVPWANHAAATYVYTLPSGAQCTGIVGNVKGPADAVVAANAFLGRDDLFKIINIDAAKADLHSTAVSHTLPNGTEVAGGPGTVYWTADLEYEHAVGWAVSTALWDTLKAQGYNLDDMSFEGALNCPGADLPDQTGTSGD